MDAAEIAPLAGVVVDVTTKGFPPVPEPVPLREVGAQGWSLEDLSPPVMVLRRSAVEHNLALMAAFCEANGVKLAPHGKTTMAPQVWRRQLEAGAWGITAASAGQASVMRAAGVERVLVANEVADPVSIRWVAADVEAGHGELACWVDSARSVELLEAGLGAAGASRRLAVLLELGHTGGRTGCRDPSEAIEVARAVQRSRHLRLCGVAGFEGTIAHDREPASLERVRTFLDAVRDLAVRLFDEELLVDGAILSAGGSLFFDLVAERLARGWPRDAGVRVVLRSGCYVTHDHGLYERGSPFSGSPPPERFHPALEVWGSVLSRPEPDLALVGLGRRDVPHDQGYPRPLTVRRPDGSSADVDGSVVVTGLNDQHAFCRLGDDTPLEAGDRLGCGISHPCTAFDRWRVIPVLDDDDHVVDAVATLF